MKPSNDLAKRFKLAERIQNAAFVIMAIAFWCGFAAAIYTLIK